MKKIVLVCFSVLAFSSAYAQSKFVTCMEASQVAQAAFQAKANKQRVTFTYEGDLVEGLVLKQAFDIGYRKVKTKKEAADEAFKQCSESNLFK